MTFRSARRQVLTIIEHPAFTATVVTLIILNAIVLGLETYPGVMASAGALLSSIDQILLSVFVLELGLRLFAQGWRFFRDPWNLFDASVIIVSLLPAAGAFSVLRALRVLRVLRLISVFPSLRRVIGGIVAALPGIGSIGAILVIIYYVSAVMASQLFGATHPQWFGTLDASLFSLFQIMTLEGWADMARSLAATHAAAIPFMIVFILVATFTVLNLFIGVMLEAMQRVQADKGTPPPPATEAEAIGELTTEVAALKEQIEALTWILTRPER